MTHLAHDRPVPDSVSPAIRRIMRFIESNCAESLPLADLASRCNLSPHRFATVFRREVGVSPRRYVCQARVRMAQSLLRDGVPPAIAAIEAGFFDQSHLYRHFKRHCGTTPGKFADASRC